MTKLRLRKEAYIPRSHLRNANNRKDQAGIFSPKSTSAVEVFAHETYLDELQDTEIKRKSIKLLRKFKQFKENTRNRSVKSARKSWSGAQENTNINRLMETMKAIQDVTAELNRETETPTRTQAEMKMELKTQLN